jgi:hypothetical protein
VKLSVSISDEDVEFLDHYATEHGVRSRSGVVQRAVSLLRSAELGQDYADAWLEWDVSDTAVWEAVIDDGLNRS